VGSGLSCLLPLVELVVSEFKVEYCSTDKAVVKTNFACGDYGDF
jgi:hypothetical protein